MKGFASGLLLAVAICATAAGQPTGPPSGEVWKLAPQGGSAEAAKPAPGAGLQWQILQIPNSPPTMVVVDPLRQVVAVYQIDAASGVITLKSVRRIVYDLRLEAFNATDPAPEAVRQMTD